MKAEYKSVAKLETRFTTDDRITVTTERFNSRDAEVKFNNLVETMSSELIVSMLSYRLALNDLTNEHPFRKPDSEMEPLLTSAWREETVQTLKKKLDSFDLVSTYQLKEKRILEMLTSYGYENLTLKENLKVGRVPGSDFINVQFVSEDPFLSAYVVNTLCEESIRYDNYLNSKRSTQSINFFADLLEEKKGILDERTTALDEFRRTAETFSRPGESNQPSGEGNLEEKRSTIISNINRLRLSIASLDRRLKNSLSPQRQNEITANIVSIRKKIDDLNANPRLKDDAVTQSKLKELADQLQVELSVLEDARSPGKTKAELAIEKEEKEIELSVAQSDLAAVNKLMQTIRKNVSSESTLDALQRQADRASEEYLDVLDRYNVEKSKAQITSPLQLAIRGQPNEEPEFPKRYLVSAISWVTGLMICIFMVVFKELTDPSIRNSDQLTYKSGLTVAATVGKVDSKNLNLNDLFVYQKRTDLDSFKNHLRKLRYEIEESGGQVLLITSTAANQGKTFLILCLSYLLSMLKKKVLVIDTNFRNNSVTQAIQRKTNGQHDDETSMERFAKGAFMADEYPKAFERSIMLAKDQLWIEVIGNSGSSMSPAEVFVGKDFQSTLNYLKEFYDYIILEGPALNDYSDTRELASYADKVISVFSAESAIRGSDKESIEFLKRLDGKFVGAILNKVNMEDE